MSFKLITDLRNMGRERPGMGALPKPVPAIRGSHEKRHPQQ